MYAKSDALPIHILFSLPLLFPLFLPLGAIRLNLLTDRVDIVRDLGWRRSTSALTDTDVKYLLLYFEQNYGLTSEKKLMAALSIVANENCFTLFKMC